MATKLWAAFLRPDVQSTILCIACMAIYQVSSPIGDLILEIIHRGI